MTFEEWLNDERTNAEREAAESHKTAMNSYGAGHDAGYAMALRLVSDNMTPEMARIVLD